MDTKNYAKIPKGDKPSLSRTSPFYGLVLTSLALFSLPAYSFEPLNDDAMRNVDGQALFTLSYLAPNDSTNHATDTNGSKNIGFYRMGMEAEIELNANIQNLQLGCGGVNGTGACDIDIKNLSLSGLNDGTVASGSTAGTPTYSEGRAGTSALLTNPFVEFAIKNPQSAATREIVGFRLSAEAIEGLLSAGLENLSTPSTTDGIQSLSGYLQIANTTGHVYTGETTFGTGGSANCLPRSGGACEALGGKISTLLGNRYFRSLPTDSGTTGITVPSLKVDFTLPAFNVNGKRQTQAVAENVSSSIPWLPIAAAGSCPTSHATACANANAQISSVDFSSDKLRVLITQDGNATTWTGDCIRLLVCLVSNSNFAMADGSALTDLNIDITFIQSLSMIHNIPLTGTGGYLSLQRQALRWPGANSDDVAQTGWWMSFAEPVDLGYLEASNPVDVSEVLPQVATFVTNSLLAGSRIDVSGGSDTITALTNGTLSKLLVIPVGAATASLTLQNQQLTSQHTVSNCWGTLKFC